ncbi:hypothetical protein [Bradyrhizobium sp. Arg816]|uniref:hypothetical protein n=1 Tax=Bradyrhizobium sp. Arg816 TaxID=2998491 RepID=UPI00249F4A90|nr:hypothetical protein [Bradyrhizobium sp. Arg816]MDI3561766.1 hypothetical protein [Bradyrhizobium sp. Arg816]
MATIAVAAQIVFSEQIVSRWLGLEWLRRECERTYDDVYRQFQSKGQMIPSLSRHWADTRSRRQPQRSHFRRAFSNPAQNARMLSGQKYAPLLGI